MSGPPAGAATAEEIFERRVLPLYQLADDAGAIESMGLRPKLVLGDARNLKVTYPQDLALAELILKNL